MKKRTIAVFTGNRAEYGLQYPILKAIEAHPDLDYKLLVSGAHLDHSFGKTLDEIENDGFHIHAEVKIDMNAESLYATAQAIGSGVSAISHALANIKPDIMVVYADRFEGFSAVIAATQMNIPTAHIEGGDITEGGALDDSVRHAMSKLAHIHFTTNEQASNRVLAMGEEDWRVHTVGFPAIDLISAGNYATPDEIIKTLGLNLDKPVVLFTQHSVTTEFEDSRNQVIPSLEAMVKLANDGVQIICTYPNNDAGGRAIVSELDKLSKNSFLGIQVHRSLGRYLYHGVLALAENKKHKVACVGNSSSGIKETPVFCCPTVDIGSRQEGRLRGKNVINCGYDSKTIVSFVNKCFYDEEFKAICRKTDNPYYIGDAGKKIAEILASIPLGKKIIRKKMTLLGEAKDGWFR
jgi:UDP-N-acetylglucosamine 2-epimerase (non-hydrolysing)/GDP/UDP-N,N'-diacetylbacillosamine 2-epimerase (hydrolysing)